ncbi:MAG: hypothetical protein HY685_02115 [Chloroflexi bacterium]|nr:hypothetical protein [Chloroflexota bacterium]
MRAPHRGVLRAQAVYPGDGGAPSSWGDPAALPRLISLVEAGDGIQTLGQDEFLRGWLQGVRRAMGKA